jgi:uncharacterized protein (DUF1778 family)
MNEKRTPGRPPVRDKSQNARLYVRAIDDEKKLMEEAAKLAGVTLSDWIRATLNTAAHRAVHKRK